MATLSTGTRLSSWQMLAISQTGKVTMTEMEGGGAHMTEMEGGGAHIPQHSNAYDTLLT